MRRHHFGVIKYREFTFFLVPTTFDVGQQWGNNGVNWGNSNPSYEHAFTRRVPMNLDVRKTKLGKRDARGRLRIAKGNLPDGTGARFQIADRETSEAEAERRYAIIHGLYEKQCKRGEVNCWNDWCRRVAIEIGKGKRITDSFLATVIGSQVVMTATLVQLRDWGIPVHVTDDLAFAEGVKVNKEQIENYVSQLVAKKMAELSSTRGAIVNEVQLPQAMNLGETTTLFEALEAFSRNLEQNGERVDGKLKAKTYTYTREVKRLQSIFGSSHILMAH